MKTNHLVILLHGLNGFGSDLDILRNKLESVKCVTVFVPECNQGRTGDGIRLGGERLFGCISNRIQRSNATHVSFVCHGIGGLYARFVLRKLYEQELLGNITLSHFITIATPHLGSRSKTKSVFNLWLDQTGKDLMLMKDENEPILLEMASEPYLSVLKLFTNLVAYSCTRRNSMVDYQSSAIRRKSIDKVELSEQSPPLLILDENIHENFKESDVEEEIMIQKLDTLDWKRMALIPPANQDYDIMNSSFWTSKLSIPVISNVVDIIKNEMMVSTSLESIASVRSTTPVHLVVLIHGLDGFSSDMEFIATRLKERYPHKIRTLAPECNHGKTYDGILNGATRILTCVKNEIKRGDVQYLSIIGHSLGGLYARCLVGLLGKEDIIPAQVTPVNFITMATPHLGSREHGKILGEKFTSLVVGSAIGLTGKELMLSDKVKSDGRPFLIHLSQPEYTKPLDHFHKLIAYANVRYDISVHYSTSAIRKKAFAGEYDVTQMNLPAVLPDNTPEPIPEPTESLEMEILHNLVQLPWKRYAVITGRPLLAHIDIIIKSVFLNLKHGFPIISHLIDRFRVNNESPKLEQALPLFVAEPQQMNPVHLIVLIPGLSTVSNDLMPLAESIRDEYPRPQYKVVVPRVNDYKSGDGILQGATRLYSWIRQEVESSHANKISFVGECVGGLYTRCVIGMLYKEKVIPDIVQPIHLITIQTQHLGTSKYVNEWLSSRFLKSLMTLTARELHLLDETPITNQMTTNMMVCLTEHDYIQPLHLFKSLVLYASVHPEQHAYYSTCALSGNELPDVDLTSHTHARIVHIEKEAKVALNSTEGKMLSSLETLPWKRFGIVPSKTGPSHYWNIQPKHPLLLHLVHQLATTDNEE